LLGLLAFCTAIGHGLLHAAAIEATLWWATLMLFAFAALGYLAGELAGWIVHDSVRASLIAETSARQAAAAGDSAGRPKQSPAKKP
jgi:hypothetical protein